MKCLGCLLWERPHSGPLREPGPSARACGRGVEGDSIADDRGTPGGRRGVLHVPNDHNGREVGCVWGRERGAHANPGAHAEHKRYAVEASLRVEGGAGCVVCACSCSGVREKKTSKRAHVEYGFKSHVFAAQGDIVHRCIQYCCLFIHKPCTQSIQLYSGQQGILVHGSPGSNFIIDYATYLWCKSCSVGCTPQGKSTQGSLRRHDSWQSKGIPRPGRWELHMAGRASRQGQESSQHY